MHQICDGYNPRVRMGNWFQESYSVAQPARDNPYKQSRQSQIDIGYIDAHLKLRPLNRMSRLPPWNTAGLVEAPQYKGHHNKTTTKQNFDLTTTQHYFRKWKPNVYDKGNGNNTNCGQESIKVNHFKKDYRMFDESNVNELINDRYADTTSFKSQIVPNKHQNQKALLQTIYQRDISNIQPNNKPIYSQSAPSPSQSNFRRIRSEITLKNVPTIRTYK